MDLQKDLRFVESYHRPRVSNQELEPQSTRDHVRLIKWTTTHKWGFVIHVDSFNERQSCPFPLLRNITYIILGLIQFLVSILEDIFSHKTFRFFRTRVREEKARFDYDPSIFYFSSIFRYIRITKVWIKFFHVSYLL